MRSLLLLLLIPAALCAQHGNPGELLTARHGAGGTWNLYMPSEKPLSWAKAQALAAEKVDPAGGSGTHGHLVTISSGAENQFVYHYIRGSTTWIGLTDNERYAVATEAGGAQDRGWAWVTGEPVTWTNWQSGVPDDGGDAPDNQGEDGVAIEINGFWNDRPLGEAGQAERLYPFMIEWDVRSKEPIPGARVIGAVLPAQWPPPGTVTADEKHPWFCLQTGPQGNDPRLFETAKSLAVNMDEATRFALPDINFRIPTGRPSNIFGWIFSNGVEFPGETINHFGMLARARLVIPRAGTYTFNVHADDVFALRLGTHPWKSVHGGGGIDPCDPATLHSLLMSSDADTRGVIELPAGEVPVEVFYINGGAEGRLQILTAEGAHPTDGSTDRWRLPGHKAAATVAWPGISAAGWKVTLPAPGAERKSTPGNDILTALVRVEDPAATVTAGLDAVNFHDPDGSRRTRFLNPSPFPGDPAGVQDDRVLLAEATLVIPADGLYHLGMTGDDLCAIQLAGQNWERIARDSSGTFARLDGDSLLCRRCDNSTSHEIVGEVRLTRGEHPIRIVSWDRNGTSVVQVFAAPSGWPARLLTRNGASEEPDIAGLTVLPFQP